MFNRHDDFNTFRANRSTKNTISLDEPRIVTAAELIAWANDDEPRINPLNTRVREHINTNDPSKVSVFRR